LPTYFAVSARAVWRDHSGCDQAVDAGPAADVHHLFASFQHANAERVAGARERGNSRFGDAVQPVIGVGEQPGQRSTNQKVEPVRRIVRDQRVLVTNRLPQYIQVDGGCLERLDHVSDSPSGGSDG
jgi:hypothetical protein